MWKSDWMVTNCPYLPRLITANSKKYMNKEETVDIEEDSGSGDMMHYVWIDKRYLQI